MNKTIKFFATAAVCLLASVKIYAQAQNITLRSSLSYPYELSNIWGYVDETGKEYALVGTEDGLSVVNVNNPDSIWKICDITAATSIWREVKQWKDFAYTVTEGGGGLMITDLRPLPVAAPTALPNSFFAFSGQGKGHTVFIDEKGVLYIFGAAGASTNGALMYDVDSIPGTPIYIGSYANATSSYIHDGYARGDTLYAAHIYGGFFSIANVANPTAPVVYNTQTTPSNFTHNTWLTNNSTHLLTTDEVNNAYLASYNVENPANVTEVDRIQSSQSTGSVPHNVHIIQGDWAVTAWYRDGILIHDASRPHNLVEVGYYDTSDQFAGGGFNGAWGVYPYLPSGNILISDIERGLFVVTPTYTKGCYLEGFVTDSLTGQPISGANVQIVGQFPFDDSKSGGNYALGIATAGSYQVRYSKVGYTAKTITTTLTNGVLNNTNVQLKPASTIAFGGLVQTTNGTPIANAQISIKNATIDYNVSTNASGNFTTTILPDTYEITVGLWGYETRCFTQNIAAPLTAPIVLKNMYQDDFSFANNWTVQTNATSGGWVKGEPVGTVNGGSPFNPEVDAATDCGDQAYITGNSGGSAGTDDVDNGATVLTSPTFDLSTYAHPFLSYERWFANGGGTGTPNDSLVVTLSNGTTNVILETATIANSNNFVWVNKLIDVKSLLTPTNTMHLTVRTVDAAPGHLVEAAFDNFKVIDSVFVGTTDLNIPQNLRIYPNPSTGTSTIQYTLQGSQPASLLVYDALGKCIKTYNLSAQSNKIVLNEKLKSGVYSLQIVQKNQQYAPQKWVIVQ
jgi:choice-of-anchor B domain-containing protein